MAFCFLVFLLPLQCHRCTRLSLSETPGRDQTQSISRIKRGIGGDETDGKTLGLLQVHFTNSSVPTVNSVAQPLFLINNGALLQGGQVLQRAEITGEMMTLKSAGRKYSGQSTHQHTLAEAIQHYVLSDTDKTNGSIHQNYVYTSREQEISRDS